MLSDQKDFKWNEVCTCRLSVAYRKQTLAVATHDKASHLDSCNRILFLCPERRAKHKRTQFAVTMSLLPLLRKHKQARLHVDPAELCNTSRELKVSLHTLEDSHVCEANLSDELEFGML